MLTTDMPGQIVELHGHVTNMYETLMGLIERIESKCDRVKSYNRDVVNGVRTQLSAKIAAAEAKLAAADNRTDGLEVKMHSTVEKGIQEALNQELRDRLDAVEDEAKNLRLNTETMGQTIATTDANLGKFERTILDFNAKVEQ